MRMFPNHRIVSGFPGVGKTTLMRKAKKEYPPLRFFDPEVRSRDRQWWYGLPPSNFFDYFAGRLLLGEIALISGHTSVIDGLSENLPGVRWAGVYPERKLKGEYLQIYRKRRNHQSWIDMMDANWNKFLDQYESSPATTHVVLKSGEHLMDHFHTLF